jgi:hypothetical protein
MTRCSNWATAALLVRFRFALGGAARFFLHRSPDSSAVAPIYDNGAIPSAASPLIYAGSLPMLSLAFAAN